MPERREGIDSSAKAVPAWHRKPMTESTQSKGDVDPELAQLQRALASVYNVERLVVRQGTMVVYQATELNPPRPITLRIFPAELNLGSVAAQFREATRLAMTLNHPNIVPTYRVGFRAGVPFFVATKPVEGRRLDEILTSQGALSMPAILGVLRGVTAALAYAHGRPTVHGALSPATIAVDREGHVLVSDFGIARLIEDAAPAAGRARVASPEEAAGGGASMEGDQYGLGIVALHMLAGSPPLGGDPLAALRNVRATRMAVSDALVGAVEKVLAEDPSERFANAAVLVGAVAAIPFSDADAREAGVVLGRLARGESVPKVRTVAAPTRAVPAVKPAPPPPPPAAPAPAPAPPDVLELPDEPVEAARAADPVPVRRSGATPPPQPVLRPSRARVSAHLAPAPAAATAPARRSRLPLVLAAVALLAAIGGGGWWFLGRKPAPVPVAQAPVATPAPSQSAAAPVTPPAAAPAAPAPADSARRDTAAATETTGVLLLGVEPTSAVIFVDGDSLGADGFLNAEVRAGRRRLQAMARGYENLDTTVTVRPGATVDLGRVSLMSAGAGRVRLRVSPATAQIFIDGRQVGVGSLQDYEVAAGRWHLTISAPGYQTYDSILTVGAGATLLLGMITLEGNP